VEAEEEKAAVAALLFEMVPLAVAVAVRPQEQQTLVVLAVAVVVVELDIALVVLAALVGAAVEVLALHMVHLVRPTLVEEAVVVEVPLVAH
jgi:hypothetical protein